VSRAASRPLSEFGTLTLAGGGNRCWWQAGVLDVWLQSGQLQVYRAAGTSAGAGVITAALCGALHGAIDSCRRAYAENRSIWRGARDGWFAHEQIYPAWIRSFLSEAAFMRLRGSGVELHAGVARLPTALPIWAGLTLGTLAYVIDKHGARRLHPRLAIRLGFSIEMLALHEAPDHEAAAHLLVSAAAAPPFMFSRRIDGRVAVDGGFADNAPRLGACDRNLGQLLLLTRHDPRLPSLFDCDGRSYLQPSVRVPVSTWDCTSRADIDGAVELGRRDGQAALELMQRGARVPSLQH